jgi:DNA-directed RNA polymerase III subunit RPC2
MPPKGQGRKKVASVRKVSPARKTTRSTDDDDDDDDMVQPTAAVVPSDTVTSSSQLLEHNLDVLLFKQLPKALKAQLLASTTVTKQQQWNPNLVQKSMTSTKVSLQQWGQVRASPFGACLDSTCKTTQESAQWHQWRTHHLPPLDFPKEKFDHVYGPTTIDDIDSQGLIPKESAMGGMVGGTTTTKSTIIAADIPLSDPTTTTPTTTHPTTHHDYGSTKTPDDAPIGALKDKWRLLPHFLKLRSLLRQHIDSFDHFVNVELKQIVQSPSACEIRSDHDPKFYLRYTDCWVGEPSVQEDSYTSSTVTPFQCRLRDCSYSAPLYVNVRYTRGRQHIVKRNVLIGRMPIMLRSTKCVLRDKSEAQLQAMKECPYDPGGYFVIKGVEKVILIQEQLSKNRVILEDDGKGIVTASITSSTHERKSKAYILIRHGRVYLKNNTLGDDIPIAIVLKAMGIESDLEMVQLVGSEDHLLNSLALSLEEPARLNIYTQTQALRYIGTKIRGRANTNQVTYGGSSYRKPQLPEDEARDVLANVVLSHVPVDKFNFRNKAIFIGHITRRVLLVKMGKLPLDDKDYYGNKRLELAGNLLSLLFEDLFKIFNKDLKRQADMVLQKPNRAQAFDVVKSIRPDTITNGMINAIATGNWVLKRFRMDRAGVTQVLSRLSYMSALGMMTRINSQFEKTRKVSGPRSLQPSQWGMLCPADTPEGEACGLVKNLALLGHITTDEDDTGPIERLCRDLGVEDVHRMTGHEINSTQAALVFLNGIILGAHTQPHRFVGHLREMRRRGLGAGEFVSVYFHPEQRAVHIATDGGRVCRPLILVDPATGLPKLKQRHLEALALGTMDIQDLLKEGVVEYVDCNEENNTLIAVTENDLAVALHLAARHPERNRKQYTHLEVDPFSILGVVGGIIPVRIEQARVDRGARACCVGFLTVNFTRFASSSLITISRPGTHTQLPWRSKPWEPLA